MISRCKRCRHRFYTDSDSDSDATFHDNECKHCRRQHEDCDRTLNEVITELECVRSELENVRSERTFLTLPLESCEATDNKWKGDVVIVVQGNTKEQVFAHKFILSIRSPVFSKMFDTKMLEEATGTVHIDDATLPVIRAVVKFCYDAEIHFTDEVTAEDVLEAAHKYDISLLQKICEDHLITTLSKENLPKRLKLSHKFEATDLEVAASKYFKRNFDSVIGNVLKEFC